MATINCPAFSCKRLTLKVVGGKWQAVDFVVETLVLKARIWYRTLRFGELLPILYSIACASRGHPKAFQD